MNKSFFITRCLRILPFVYCMCLMNISCQHNNKIVNSDNSINSVYAIEKNATIPSHLNADISSNDSTLQLQYDCPWFNYLCNSLGLNSPTIKVFGNKDIEDGRLVKMYVEDLSHSHLYLLLFDKSGHLVDSISSPNPINGDYLGDEEGAPVEWHYYSNFYFSNELINKTMSYDIKKNGDQIDTLHCAVHLTKYKVTHNKIVEFSSDSIVKGKHF